MAFKGKVLKIEYSIRAALKTIFSGRGWALTFKCGNCKIVSTVLHDEEKKWHKCPTCNEINKLKQTSWYDLYD